MVARPGRAPVHAMAVAGVAARCDTDIDAGLSRTEAARRLVAYGPNALEPTPTVPWWRRLVDQFASPLVILLIVAIAVSLVAWRLGDEPGAPWDAVVIAVIVIANAVIGLAQQQRAEAAVAALAELTAVHARVIRDGSVIDVPASDLVVGDIVALAEGDAVSADGRLVDHRQLSVSEASLTGESAAVRKGTGPVAADTALGDRTSMAFSGTAVVSGHGRMIVTATGMDTEVGAIAALLSETESRTTPLERELQGVGRTLGVGVALIAVVVVGALVLASDVETGADLVEILLVGVSLAVAAVPEGLPAVLSIVLALGVQRMATRNALVKHLASVETLGSATVICTDKTGTLTRNAMTVRTVVTAGGAVELRTDPDPPPNERVEALADRALRVGALASHARAHPDPSGWRADGDPTEVAIAVAAATRLGRPADHDVRPLDELAFSSDRRRMSVLVDDPSSGGPPVLCVKGAPDVLLARCRTEATPDGDRPLDDERLRWWTARTDALADVAMRTIAVASRRGVVAPLTDNDEQDLTLIGVVGIIDPPRDEAAPAVATAHAAGVRVIMITGDHPRTATQIADELGITGPGAPVLTGADLDELDDDALAAVVGETDVFARVTPAHKLRLVAALQRTGEIVAMTGDGVNDAPALKAADIGTAMGITGTDVAREAAAMVLTDDDFATIPAAIGEGRAIFHNIRSFLRYLLSSNVGEVLTMLLGVILAGVIGLRGSGVDVVAPLTAAQILWINLLTDTGPALALGIDPADPGGMQRPPRPKGAPVIDATMQRGIAIVGLTMALATLLVFDISAPGGLVEGSHDLDTARTAAFTTLVLAQLCNVFGARSDTESAFHRWAGNRWLLAAVAASLLAQVAVVHLRFMNDAFATAPLRASDWLVCALASTSVLWVSEVRKARLRRAAPGLGRAAADRPRPGDHTTANSPA